jgi:signal transduction histidine kinase
MQHGDPALVGQLLERAARLEASNAELEALVCHVVHELRSAVRAIGTFTQAVVEDHREQLSPRGCDHLSRAHAAARRVSRLIDDVLELGRARRVEPRRETVDLSALASAVAAEQADGVPRRNVRVVVAPGMSVRADPRLLSIVLTNLIGNAIKFSGRREQPTVTVDSYERDGERVFFVRDDGVGFDASAGERLFVPFVRLHGAGEFEGTGLGLAIARRIVEAHGGRIWAEGTPDAGATFSFTLDPPHDERASRFLARPREISSGHTRNQLVSRAPARS